MTKTHRVGSITLGIILILFGILLLTSIFVPALTYANILQFWPVTFILLGCEILFANFRSEKVHFRYDGWSILFLFFVLIFSTSMGILDYCVTHFPQYINI